MAEIIDLTMFWNYRLTLTYNAIFMLIVGLRGGGKSYGVKELTIDDFLKHGHQFVYLRRYKTEFDKIHKYWDDIREAYPEHTFDVKGGQFYIDDEVAGYYFAMTQSSHFKSTPFPKVKTLVLDEFIIDDSQYLKYLKNEVEVLFDIIETVFRLRRPRVFLLANKVSETNPYYNAFDVKTPRNKKKIYCKDDVLVQYVEDAKYKKAKEESDFYKIPAVQKYKRYAVNNEALRDKKDFVLKKPPKDLRYLFTLKSSGLEYGVYEAYRDGFWYVSENVDPTCQLIYVTKLDDHTPNTMLLKGSGKSVYIKRLIENFKTGLVYFSDTNTYNIVLDAVKGSM